MARLNPCPSFNRTNLISFGQALFKAINQDWFAAYFQPSLRDWIVLPSNPGLRPGLNSAVPPGLSLDMEYSRGLKSTLSTRFLQDKILNTTTSDALH